MTPLADDLKSVRASQVYHYTQNNAGCKFSKVNNQCFIHHQEIIFTRNMQREPEFNVEMSLYENVSNLSNVPKLCDAFVETLICSYVESKESSRNLREYVYCFRQNFKYTEISVSQFSDLQELFAVEIFTL